MSFKVLVYRMSREVIRKWRNLNVRLHQEYFYEFNLNQEVPSLSAKANVKIRSLQSHEASLLQSIWPVDLQLIDQRLQSGHSKCYLSIFENYPVGYHWVQFKDLHFVQPVGKNIEVKENVEFVIYHTRVKESMQGNGINTFVLSQILKEFRSKGFKRGLIYTSSTNIANQRSLEKLGFYRYSSIKSFQVGKKYFPLSTSEPI